MMYQSFYDHALSIGGKQLTVTRVLQMIKPSEKGLPGDLRYSRIKLPFDFSFDGCAFCSPRTFTILAGQHGWLLLFCSSLIEFLIHCKKGDFASMEFEGFEVGFHLVEACLMFLLNLLDD